MQALTIATLFYLAGMATMLLVVAVCWAAGREIGKADRDRERRARMHSEPMPCHRHQRTTGRRP